MIPAGETASRPRKRIGKYLVTGRIGRGGMGMVYSGLDETLEREVAIKTLTAEGTFDDESRKRFEIEAKAAAKLQHPNILTVFELGEERGVPFIAMELLPGADLETLLRSGDTLLLQEKLDVVIQVCRGLSFAHEHRIVHRDIKPSNIRVLDDGTVKIMDFGIAKLQGTGVTKAGMMVGTVHYMSPEQIRGKTLDGRSDVFSLGVILYELLAGTRPFPGDSATAVLYKIVHDPPAPLPLPDELGEAGRRLQEISDRALAKDADQRFGSASEMADALSEVLASHVAAQAVPLPPQGLEAVSACRRLLKEGRVEESVRRLRDVVERNPDSLEPRRALRAASRELQHRQRSEGPETEEFPELDATFQAPPTRMSPETATVPQPTLLAPTAAPASAGLPASAARPAGGGILLAGVGLTLVAAIAAGFLLIKGSGGTGRKSGEGQAQRVQVRSQPSGAAVFMDGQDTGIVTDAELLLPPGRQGQVLLSFKKAGHRDESRTVNLPLSQGEVVAVTLGLAPATVAVVTEPAGAGVALDGQKVGGVTPLDVRLDPARDHRLSVSLDGYASQEVRLAANRVPPQLRLTLEPAGPLGTVTVASSYPVDVLWKGRSLAKGQTSPRVSLPQGRQVLTLVAGAVFLRTNLTVDVKGETTVQAPGVGKINIRANPDNCEVFIDGISAGYLPILDKTVAAGSHSVVFKWPDGIRREEAAEVAAGRPAYVMGRRD